MPLYEYECIKCRSNLERALKSIEKKANKETAQGIVNKYYNIHCIEIVDLEKNEIVAQAGEKKEDCPEFDFYLKEGTLLVLVNMDKYRFAELVYKPEDEKNVKCRCGEKRKVEKVVSSFAFTSDLSTDMPKPDLSGLPPQVRNRMVLGDYIEEKDRPKKNR